MGRNCYNKKMNPGPRKIINNLIIELHVPDFNKVKEFYSVFDFGIAFEYLPNEKEPGYLRLSHPGCL